MIFMMQEMRDETIKRVHRQHNSLLIVVPVAVRSLLGIQNGDYVYFSWVRGRKNVTFGKVVLKKGRSNGSKKHTDTRTAGRRVRAKG